uniref:Uncharacterized protein n=1 Tax=Arundo donax TaxID=35708 RepID=A0A0A8YH63_ARUDO
MLEVAKEQKEDALLHHSSQHDS